MSEISLNASMRSNLLSLQQTQMLQDMTQLRLSTGLKVNSAIDNPSSYYTASSLNNRAKDLSQLLDAMGQGIQTIKTASETLETATKFLEQAKAYLSQELDSPNFVAKEAQEIDYTQYTKLDKTWFEGQIGANDAVVSTAQELKDAIAANKSTIVVYGKIDFTNETITLKANQKLVGTEYFADRNSNALYRVSNDQKFSSLSFNNSTAGSTVTINKDGCEISDLSINSKISTTGDAVRITGVGVSAKIRNINISYEAVPADDGMKGAIGVYSKATLNLEGTNNITMSSYNIRNEKALVWGVFGASNATVNIYGETKISCSQDNNANARGLVSYINSTINIYGTVDVQNCEDAIYAGGKFPYGDYSGNTVNIKESAVLNFNTRKGINIGQTDAIKNVFNIEKGTKIYWHNQKNASDQKAWQVTETKNNILSIDNDIGKSLKAEIIFDDYNYQLSPNSFNKYNSILSQYDMLIADASYKGINLLTGGNLKISFNEEHSSKIEIKGEDATSESLGLKSKKWNVPTDLSTSINEVEAAINQIRTFSSQFGSYYSIVSSRQDFTENLINVLTEGSDKLTLADMNEESANMLALQTRQQLAINSLSLASQASRSVLNLF